MELSIEQVVQLFKQFENYVNMTKNSGEEDNAGRWSRKQAELFFAREAARLLSEDPAPLQAQISQLLHSNPDYAEAVCILLLFQPCRNQKGSKLTFSSIAALSQFFELHSKQGILRSENESSSLFRQSVSSSGQTNRDDQHQQQRFASGGPKL